MVGKLKMAMGFRKSPKSPSSTPPNSTSTSESTGSQQSQKGVNFSRSFGVYSPRTLSQVQPRPPEVTELLHLVDELRERESLMKTQLLQQKLLKESVDILPFLENQVSAKESEIVRFRTKIDCLEDENEKLRQEVEMLHLQLTKQSRVHDQKVVTLQENISDLKKTNEELLVRPTTKITRKDESFISTKLEIKVQEENMSDLRSYAPRIPKPPPKKPSSVCSSSSSCSSVADSYISSPPPSLTTKVAPPPPPPPPLPVKGVSGKVKKLPEVVEFYHSLMRRESRPESKSASASASTAKDMIGEIENRSVHLLAIKTDVETQGDFIRFLIKEVENTAFTDIGDVVPFVKWLDDELSYLVDERAVLKHFNWPEQKADALREAAFGYCDLMKLLSEASSFRDDPRQHFTSALKKIQALFEKLEHGVYNLSRMRESASNRYKLFNIPTNWMQDTGCVTQMKVASVKLAMKYMKKVCVQLEIVGGSAPEEEELIVQGVRFAFRAHQFAGGFDIETMRAFEELRDKATLCHIQCKN